MEYADNSAEELIARIRELEAALAEANVERDEAVGLLRFALTVDDEDGTWKEIRAFLARIGSKP